MSLTVTGDNSDPSRIIQLIMTLRRQGITDGRVLGAIERTPRDVFVERAFEAQAYDNNALPIECGQTISQPYVVGFMTTKLEVTDRMKVLEIGTGSGYQAAILSQLARRVYTVDRHRRLMREAQAMFERLDLTNVTAICADGSRGVPEQAPFDRILVTAAAEDPPGPLLAELREGGIMVLPVGQSDAVQSLIKVTRTADGFDYEELRSVRFVPLVEGLGKE